MLNEKGHGMTKFDKNGFFYWGGFLSYMNGADRKVVARFKHRGPVTKAIFLKELIKNHTVESYFAKIEVERKAPVEILRDANPSWYEACVAQFKAKMA